MPERNDDLFHRLRRAGVRKPVAKALSELTEDAGKKAAGAGHRAVAELRALADEIEKRLPAALPESAPQAPPAPVATARATRTKVTEQAKKVTARAKQVTAPAKQVTEQAKEVTAPATPGTARAKKVTAPAKRVTAQAKKVTAPAAKAAQDAAPAASRSRKPAARPSGKGSSPAPRGENKAKILEALKSGPHTASEVSEKTGIATATVSTALTRLSKAGDITKAERGYSLPS